MYSFDSPYSLLPQAWALFSRLHTLAHTLRIPFVSSAIRNQPLSFRTLAHRWSRHRSHYFVWSRQYSSSSLQESFRGGRAYRSWIVFRIAGYRLFVLCLEWLLSVLEDDSNIAFYYDVLLPLPTSVPAPCQW